MRSERSSLRRGVAAVLGSGTSTQVGAALAARAFPTMGPVGVVAIRQIVAAVALMSMSRPSMGGLTRRQWMPVVGLACIFVVMNLSLYVAIDRIGLGLAVTLEFLGPLAIAVLGSKRRTDLLIAGVAGVGVYVLILPDSSSDLVGIGLALLAAGCWAAYILVNRVAGNRLPGLQAPALASTIAAIVYLPVLGWLIVQGRLTGAALLYSIGAGVLSSAVPYATDLIVLRTVPPRLFGVLMSAQPGLAALAGLVLLGQVPAGHEWAGIAIIAFANVAAVSRAERATRPTHRVSPNVEPIDRASSRIG